jgi:PAS domain S-box-containing protein
MTDPSSSARTPTDDLLECCPGMLAQANVQGSLASVNPRFAAGLGRDPSELLGVSLSGLAHPEDQAAVAAGLTQAGDHEHRFAHADGTWRRWQWAVAPATGDGLLISAHDVTALRAAAETAGRDLDVLTAAVAHDLRAPLRAIDGFSQILLGDPAGALPDDTRRFLALVRDAGTDLADLLDDLVAVARVARAPLHRREVDPARLVGELIDAVLRPGQGDRAVTWVVCDVPPCAADGPLLRRLLGALLDNALKFTAPHPTARIEFSWDAGRGAYAVRDDGIGLDGDLPEQALTLFGRLHGREAFPGRGAGLALAARIAERHGGRVWGHGSPGAGTTVWFSIGREP